MPGSFEKKVQEKMEELKLTPSAPVWEKIETQLKPERQRRKAWLWFPFLILLMAGAGWWLLTGSEDRNPKSTASKTGNTTQTQTTPTNHSHTTADTTNTTNNSKLTADAPVQPHQQAATKGEKTPAPIQESELTVTTKRKGQSPVPEWKGEVTVSNQSNNRRNQIDIAGTESSEKGLPKSRNRKESGSDESIAANEPKASDRIAKATLEKGLSVVPEEKKLTEANAPVLSQQSTVDQSDSAVQNKLPEKKPVPVINDTAALKRKIASASKKWRPSLTLQTGWQSNVPGGTSPLADYAGGPTQNNGNPPLNSGGSFGYRRPNPITKGRALSVGVNLSKELSRQLEFGVGVQYTAFRFQTRTGSFRPLDTALSFRSQSVVVGGYYFNSSQSDYTLRYGLLSLPVSLSYRFTASSPLSLLLVASYGRVLSGNALGFDRSVGVYFRNNENLNRNQFSLSSSLQYRLVNRTSFRINAGPVVHYQVTNFHKDKSWTPDRFFMGFKSSFQF